MNFDDEELDWNSSKIKGFSFGDDDETPWEELSRYQTISDTASGVSQDDASNSVISFATTSNNVVSDRVKKAIRIYSSTLPDLSGLSISEAVGGSSASTERLPTDPRELRAELIKAKRQLVSIEKERYKPLHPRETVQNIFLGQDYVLEFYKSLQDKTDLIDEALNLLDGNAILVVTLFLKRTLSESNFLALMGPRPLAVRHITNYLEERGQIKEACQLLKSVGQNDRAGIIQYKHACKSRVNDRIRHIKAVSTSYFNTSAYVCYLQDHVHLLERLLPVIDSDTKNPNISSDPVFNNLKNNSVSVLKFLLYLSYFHHGEPDNLLSSPDSLKKIHKLSDSQLSWIALIATAKKQHWKDCEVLVTSKGWLGGKKLKSCIDAKTLVRILDSYGASAEVLQEYLPFIEDIQDRENYAKRYNAHNVVVDCMVAKKDRNLLSNYIERLIPNSKEWFYANNALGNSKWSK